MRLRAARRLTGMVLLKNDGGLLPVAADASVAIIGSIARAPRFQGARQRPGRIR